MTFEGPQPQLYYYKMITLNSDEGTGEAKFLAFEKELKKDNLLDYMKKNLKVRRA